MSPDSSAPVNPWLPTAPAPKALLWQGTGSRLSQDGQCRSVKGAEVARSSISNRGTEMQILGPPAWGTNPGLCGRLQACIPGGYREVPPQGQERWPGSTALQVERADREAQGHMAEPGLNLPPRDRAGVAPHRMAQTPHSELRSPVRWPGGPSRLPGAVPGRDVAASSPSCSGPRSCARHPRRPGRNGRSVKANICYKRFDVHALPQPGCLTTGSFPAPV